MTWEPSEGNEDPERQVNLSISMLGSMKNGQSCRKMTGQVREDAVSVLHLGELGKARLFLCLIFGDESAAACWALSQEGLMSCFRGEGQGEGQSGCPVSAIFSDSFHLKYFICQAAVFGGCVSQTPSNAFLGPAKPRGDSILYDKLT